MKKNYYFDRYGLLFLLSSKPFFFCATLCAWISYGYGATRLDSDKSRVGDSDASNFEVRPLAGCSPVSTMPCENIKVSLPFNLSFDTPVAGTIADKTGIGTGFTTVNPYSGTRAAADGAASVVDVPGYEPSRITLTGGRLNVLSNKGIDFQGNNNQLNVLGASIKTARKLQLEVKVVNPYNGAQSQQAGLYYGLNDRTFIKLGIAGNKVELRKERNDVSSATTGLGNPDQRRTETIDGLSTKTVSLRMIIDSLSSTVEGFYSTDGVSYSSTGALYTVPSLNISGTGLLQGDVYAGVYTTYRNGSTPITFTFDDFSVTDLGTAPVALDPIRINFRPSSSAPPTGYTADNGLPFDATRKYGWINAATQMPSNYSGNTRLRTGVADARQLSLIQMQATSENTAPGAWEHIVPNGLYTVVVSAGDNGYYNSVHQINVEGLPAISDFAPYEQNKFRVATATVQVNDGKLTIHATGGSNTKINYVTITPAAPVNDAVAPVASARISGVLKSPNVYDGKANISITATDAGGSGLARLQYSINDGAYINYTVPFTLETAGNYNLKVKAADANNNETITSPYVFTIQSPILNVRISFQPTGTTVPASYTADTGLPFDATRKFGWFSSVTQQPSNYSGNMRLRTGSGDLKQLSLVQMQAPSENTDPGIWEYIVPNGMYTVTVSAGDNQYYSSNHQINIEGLPAISDFIPSAQNKFRIATATVQVNDGRLTIDATGGRNSKMNYATFQQTTPVTDAVAPVAGARLEGEIQSGSTYKNEVQVYITATDAGGAGLSKLEYSLNNGAFVNYTVPFKIQVQGSHNVRVRATDANNNETTTSPYAFSIVGTTGTKTLSFSVPKLSFTVLKGKQVGTQSVNVIATPPTSFVLSKTAASWLTLPGTSSNTLQFGPQNINSNVEPGFYQALVTGSADGYEPATMLIDLNVIEPLQAQAVNVNFQDAQTVPSSGYVKDYGQPFGLRTGVYQGAGLKYGWKKRTDGSLLDISGNGRNRDVPDDVSLATFMHMQANHITGAFSGVKTEGYWELKVPNGSYDVTLVAGDAFLNSIPEIHYVKVEGVNAISGFVPSGAKGAITRFKFATVRVNVADELLTVNADGGTNTKINFANITPVSVSPYLYWASKTSNIIIDKTGSGTSAFPVILGNSNGTSASYTINAVYEGSSGWLVFNSSVSGVQPNVSFDFTAARSLPVGIYKVTLTATSGQFTSAVHDVQLNVVDGSKPYVIASSPANGATKVSLSTVSIAANNLHIPVVPGVQGGVNNSTITSSSVKLLKIVDNVATEVAGVVQGTGGGDVISFSPSSSLAPNTVYKFIITSGVKSYADAAFAPYEATFSTAAAKIDSGNILNAQFAKVPVPGTQNKKYCSLVIGPDGKFYALRLDGVIERYQIDHSNGMLSGVKIINTLVNRYGLRSAIGLAFDPNSTTTNVIAYVSHSSSGLSAAPAFDGNISRLQGDSLQTEQLIITKLPRSKRDHLINSLAFGPDQALYMSQGSNSSAGSYDGDWQRDESLLSGAILRLDLGKLNGITLPLDVQTTATQSVINAAPAVAWKMSDGTYNPYGSTSPLTIYGSGVRNAYDLLWHSNGQLYVPTNGSGGGGNSPASVAGTRRPNGSFYSGPAIPATNSIKVQYDWLFRINPNRPIGYFGHPNPLRGEYVLNRGYADNPLYLPSIGPDANYRIGYNFGLNNSPNGVLEYKSNTFNGILKGKILVCRFSGGGDIAVMEPGSKVKTSNPADDAIYDVIKVTTGSGNNGLIGMSGFGNPLDIVEDVANGNLYIVEYNWNDSPNLTSQITLLRAYQQVDPAPELRVVTTSSGHDASDKEYEVTMSNKGGGTLHIEGITISGPDHADFKIGDFELPSAAEPIRLEKDSSVTFKVFASALADRSSRAKLVITTEDNTRKEVDISTVVPTDLNKIVNGSDDHLLSVFPNPSFGSQISVQLAKFNRQEPVTVYVYDMNGRIVKSLSAVADREGKFLMEIGNKDMSTQNFIVSVVYLSGFKSVKVVNN
jgi:hypothetical protein